MVTSWRVVRVEGRADERIAAITEAQAGLISRSQALEAGLTDDQIATRLHRRSLQPVHRGVYRSGTGAGPHAAEIAALLTRPIGALVCGARAAGLYGWRPVPEGVDLLIPTQAGGGRRTGIRIHRTSYPDLLEPAWIDGIPVAAPAVVVLELGAELGPRSFEILVDEAITSGRVNHRELREMALRHRAHPGARRLADPLERRAVGNPTGSPGQERLLELTRLARLPDPYMDHPIGNGFSADLYWPDVKVALEYDSYRYHHTKAAWLRDRRKQAHCEANGIVLTRVDDTDLDQHAVAQIARVAAAMAARAVATNSARDPGAA